jgi:hypothetical protein
LGNSANLAFSITNSGNANLTGVDLLIDGPDAAMFSVLIAPAATISPSTSTAFTIQFAPSAAEARKATLHIASTDPLNNPFNVNLSGTGAVPALVVEQPAGTPLVNGTTASFGSIGVGSSTTLAIMIKNSGLANLTGLAITIDGSSSSDYSVATGPVQPVLPGSTTSFSVRFAPGASGARSANLLLASNDPAQNPFNIVLNGVGTTVVINPGSDAVDGPLFPPGAAALRLCLTGPIGCRWILKGQSH